MICAKCGADNPSESAYCGGCGALLVPRPAAAVGTPGQEPPASSPSEPVVQPAAMSSDEDMPTIHAFQPPPAQNTPSGALEEAPTLRVAPAQPTPAASEFMNVAPSTPQGGSGANNPLVSPTPGTPQVSGPLPAPVPVFPGAMNQPQGPAPAPVFPGAVYPQQVPGAPGVVYPPQGAFPAPGILGAVPVAGFPSVAYPPNTPQPTPGVFPPTTPLPGSPGSSSPAYASVSGVFPPQVNEFPAGAYPSQPLPQVAFPGAAPGQPTPSGVFPGAYPGQPLSSGVFPGAYPGQPGPGSWGAYGAPTGMPVAQPGEPSKLIKPLPLWAFIASIVVVAALLGLLTFFTGSDWAAGAKTAGIIALVLGTLLLIAFGVRTGLGMLAQTNPHRRAQIFSSLLLTLLLIAVGAIGLGAQSGIHSAQARYLAGQQQWQTAINEYGLGGQNAPASEDIASVYNEWGQMLVNNQQYADGIAKFEIVINKYTQSPNALGQAKSNAIDAYTQWAQSAVQAQKYDQATQHYDALLQAEYCNNTCQAQASKDDANAYYKLAEQKLNQQPPDYANAVAAFNQLTTRFSSSSLVQQAHADYAKALWGDGQQLLNTTCSSALTLYQQLSSQFSDTPQGQQATTALTQPAKVKGHFTSNIPSGSDVPAVGLVQGISAGMSSDQFYAALAKSPIASVKSDGTFVFDNIKQASYYLVWGTLNQSANKEVFSVSQRYPANVGPLCGFDFGDINETFPLA